MSSVFSPSTSIRRAPSLEYWGGSDTQDSVLSTSDMAYDTWVRTINPSQLHTSSSASFSSTHTPSDPPSTPSSYAIELETIPLDQWSSWLKDVVQEDEPSALNITLTETWSEHKQDTARFDEAPSMTDSAMDVDPAEQRWPSQTPARQGIIPLSPFSPATPSPFDGPMFPVRAVTPILTSSPAVDSPLSEPLVVTPTTPNKRSAVPSLDSFIPLAQRRTRRNVSAPTRAHVDLKAVLGESSDDNDAGEVERRTKPAVKAPASPKRPPPRPSPDFDYTSSDESEDAYRQAKKPRVASASSGKSKGPSRKVYRRDPEKRRTQNEEAQRGYRQRRTAKFEAYQSGFEQLRQLYDSRSLNDKMKVRKAKDIIAVVERIIEQNTPVAQRCTSC